MKIEVKDFNLKDTLLSGQVFRVKENKDSSFTVILFDRIIIVKQEKNTLYVESSNNDNLEEVIKEYFDLNRDYDSINNKLKKDKVMNECIKNVYGYKILNQAPFEMEISYIISQNNKVDRIASIVNKISEKYGNMIDYKGETYYLFPRYDQLKSVSLEELKDLKVGFRDKYIKYYLEHYNDLNNLDNLDTKEAIDKLMSFYGIGLKVASCILLFGYKRLDVFPIDTWVIKFISDNYKIKSDQKTIKDFAEKNFNEYSGLAIQYMFHSQRNIFK